mmetsp:Transcript_13830/g.39598  ORF Transcript_13830/g.39598 Transcript_13830/m.39598 type:complete len:389 (+) Transcript_13830:187-1353(+)
MAGAHPEGSAATLACKSSTTPSSSGGADCDVAAAAAAEHPDCEPASDENEGEDKEGDGDGELDGEEDGEPSAADEADEWEEIYACPLNIRFTQEKIHPFFYRRGPIVNVVPRIRPVMHNGGDDFIELVPPFNPIHCLRKGNELWSLDNRRLYALQLASMEQWPRQCRVRLLCRDRLPRHKFKTQYRKFNTTSEGRTLDVCARYQQFDTWNWFERAVELEWYTFSGRLGTLLSVFEVMPVVGALLFRTGLTGFASRVPLVAGFVLTFAVDFMRQKVAIIERKICEIHVRAVMDGDVRQLGPCCRRLQLGGEEEPPPSSAVQLAASMALALLLLLPYVLGIAYEKLRSSLLSCWLGVACVLIVQLGSALRGAGEHSDSGYNGRLSPKHRD